MNNNLLLSLLISLSAVPTLCSSPVQTQLQTQQPIQEQLTQAQQSNYDLAYKTLKYGAVGVGGLALFYAAVVMYAHYKYDD